MALKKCTKCDQVKDIEKFYKDKTNYRNDCKNCTKIARKSYSLKDPILFREKRLKRYKNNPIIAKTAAKKWRLSNLDVDRQNKKKYHKYQMLNNVQYKLAHYLRIRLRKAIKYNHRSGSAVRDLGCSIYNLKKYLESKFKPGMTWDNWGQGTNKWNLDHKRPLSSFNLSDPAQSQEACHYSNLQPLWEPENLKKGNKYGS